jgi:hypothetical protein
VIYALTQAPVQHVAPVEFSDEADFDDVVSKYTEIYDLLRRDYYLQDNLDLSAMKE